MTAMTYIDADPAVAVADARALVADPHRAIEAGAQARLMAWAVLVWSRGGHCRQIQMIRDQRLWGLR